MAELGRDGTGAIDEDRLPWLEPVDDVDAGGGGGVAAGKLIGAVIAALVAIGLIIGGSFWLRQRNVEVADGGPATIPPPPGPYKVKPAEPGGMKVPGQGDASYSASTGADPNAQIDTSAVAEAPVKGTPAKPATPPAPAAAKAALPAAPTEFAKAEPKPAPAPSAAKPAPAAPVAGGAQIQLGSFSSAAKANAAWKALTTRFAYLQPLQQVVANGTVGGNAVYRLRAVAGDQAKGICGKLKVAGETCIIAPQ